MRLPNPGGNIGIPGGGNPIFRGCIPTNGVGGIPGGGAFKAECIGDVARG